MPFSIQRIRRSLKAFDFETLFIEELGWDYLDIRPQHVLIGDDTFRLAPVAQKKGVQIFMCGTDADGRLPDYATRQKIDRQVTKWAREHVIIFVDDNKTTQIWQWVKRQQGKPTAYREHAFHTHQSGEALIQKLRTIAFTLEEEEFLLLSDVTYRLEDALDKEQVTKKFYKEFDKERKAFLKALKGIELEDDREWYTSVMLNRLMFVYFIQKKGFLDGNVDYLRGRLKTCREEFGNDQFYSFYRTFLLRLFHDGLACKVDERDAEVNRLIGDIPYLNGGIFQPHELERTYDDLDIPDGAFERVFDFFDDYQWHLDYRPLQDDREINPDVLGYIFEQYINQKQMGAYYTKEDITGYISRNTILPFLFDEARKGCKEAFEGDQSVWKLLQDDPDRYIYPAVRHGIYDNEGNHRELPDEVVVGLDDVSKRDAWNTLAPSEYALPTEIWREVVARRRRYGEVRGKLERGEVRDINDLITLNLDIEQFAQDVVETCEGPYLLRAFFKVLQKVTILDPTCGSGAFLFAALEILEPLYLACLTRMQAFVEDLERSGEAHHPKKFEDFRKVLDEALDEAKHPNLDYYVYKSIILNNLYGVDIMEEAVEICKLRLFLKLAAQVERKEHLEPLPDIDFNIRAGNTLVGYATFDEAKAAVQSKLDFDDAWPRIEQAAEDVAVLADLFREQQNLYGGTVNPEDKRDLRDRLRALENELNGYLAAEYGVKMADEKKYRDWLVSHQPFHWFVEFHTIMNSGGFDVVIGNPPYVEYREIKDLYTILNYRTEDCGNLYAYVIERAVVLMNSHGRLGQIIPVASVCTDRYAPLQRILRSTGDLVISNYSDRPSKLFDGLEHIRLSIILQSRNSKATRSIYTTQYNKWHSEQREYLFNCLNFVETTEYAEDGSIPKLHIDLEHNMLEKFRNESKSLSAYETSRRNGKSSIYYTRKLSGFVQILDFIPAIYKEDGSLREPSELKEIRFGSERARDIFLALLNSSLFYWLLTIYSDCRNLNKRDVYSVRFDLDRAEPQTVETLQKLRARLMGDMQTHSELKEMNYKKLGKLSIQCIYPKFSKPIIDEIDRMLAQHYGFNDEELDFIINYDIKYRMGVDTFEEEDFEEAAA